MRGYHVLTIIYLFYEYSGNSFQFNCIRAQNTTNPAQPAQPEWKSRNNAHMWPPLPCNDQVIPGPRSNHQSTWYGKMIQIQMLKVPWG